MMTPRNAGDLRGLPTLQAAILAVDPGRKTGICIVSPTSTGGLVWRTDTVALDELSGHLRANLAGSGQRLAFVVCEDYTMRGGVANNDPKVPAAQGIGMCRTACEWTDTAMYLIQPVDKRAGRSALPGSGRDAYSEARGPHARDAVALAGFALREMGRPA